MNEYGNQNPELYWADLPPDELGTHVAKLVDHFYDYCNTSNKMNIWQDVYENLNQTEVTGTHLNRAGQSEELTTIFLAEVSNLQSHLVSLITQQRVRFRPQAINSDYKTLTQTDLAKNILDYEMREKGLEKILSQTVEKAVSYGDAAIVALWNASVGDEIVEVKEDIDGNEIEEVLRDSSGQPYRSGDIEYHSVPAFDIIRDPYAPNMDRLDWVIIRLYVNRYDLIAQYANVDGIDPDDFESEVEYAEAVLTAENVRQAILSAESRPQMRPDTVLNYHYASTADSDIIPVYHFFHRKTSAMPDGRYAVTISDGNIVLEANDLPYEKFPVNFISPSEITGTPFGTSPIFNILSPAKAYNATMSTILTNQRAFGVHNVIVPNGSKMKPSSLKGGLNFIPYIPDDRGNVPQVLDLLKTPAEVFEFANLLKKEMETLVGINSVIRGDPDYNLTSGSSMALVASQALHFVEYLQQSYIHCVEKVGSCIISMYQQYADTPRTLSIVGKANRSKLREFKKEDIQNVDRVTVDIGSAFAKTVAGKVEIARDLMQMGLLKTPEDYMMVIETGQLDTITEQVTSELIHIQDENERLQDGDLEGVIALSIDSHLIHIQEHKSVLASTDARQNPEIVEATLAHINEHIEYLKDQGYAFINSLMGQPVPPPGMPAVPLGTPPQPLGQPAMGVPPMQPAQQSPALANDNRMNQADIDRVMDPRNPAQTGSADIRDPNMPNMPVNPLTGERYNNETGGL